MPQQKQAEPETYSSVLKNIRDLSGKKKASALLPVMRTMTKYLHKGDSELIDATLYHILKYAELLKADLDSAYFARVLSALKAYCVALKYAGQNDTLKSVVLQYANEAKEGRSDMSHCLAELFCIIRFCELDCEELDAIIQWGVTTSDPAVLRHCLGMLLAIAPEAPERAARLLHDTITNASTAAVISQDTLASVCYVKLCWALYKAKKDAAYLRVLCR
ncbi:hypothetical protein AV274_5546, partial [Blastocystis sp. ATCC 50177/Nand II]